eukprot:TRINITY_DN7235_c0_g1_i1.p1 TRINITY_DN7235_c0_g1~~TRINITY_DN7235_c0_g1_i1.p1  ORF type:complete len:170 (-),score=61.48 TRINITY_DN7235_c0_g1_i1:249-758(-)
MNALAKFTQRVASAAVARNSVRAVAVRSFADDAKAGAGPLRLAFATPTTVYSSTEEIASVTVPAVSGVFTVTQGHVPTIAQLIPGVVSVTKGNETSEYFVSGGFAVVDEAETFVNAVEAVPVSELDEAAARAGLAEFTAKAQAGDDLEKARATIGVQLYQAILSAIGAK